MIMILHLFAFLSDMFIILVMTLYLWRAYYSSNGTGSMWKKKQQFSTDPSFLLIFFDHMFLLTLPIVKSYLIKQFLF